ncbi:MAG: uroporphyrinogen-III C-methyltransferase [Pseudomonadota bacterium]
MTTEQEQRDETEVEATPDTEASASDTSDVDATAEAPNDETPEAPKKKGSFKRSFLIAMIAAFIGAFAWFGWQKTQNGSQETGTEQTETAAGARANEQAPATNEVASSPISTTLAQGDIIERASIADIDNLRGEIESLTARVTTLDQALNDARSEVSEQTRTTSRLEDDINNRVDLLDSLPGRVRNNEEAIVTIKGISAGSRKAWLIAEAEYYLQIANAQIQLANNPVLAAAALELADQRVRELADPTYTAVRRSIADELAALRSVNGSDIEGMTLTLGSLASMVPTLPLKTEDIREQTDATAGTEDLRGWARVKQTTSNFFSGMFSYRREDEPLKPMLAPEAEYFLRQNLQLQLQAARLSLLLGEAAAYQQSIEDADTWLAEYFAPDDAGVTAARDMLKDVQDVDMNNERPDISGSLTLLRQLRDIGSSNE